MTLSSIRVNPSGTALRRLLLWAYALQFSFDFLHSFLATFMQSPFGFLSFTASILTCHLKRFRLLPVVLTNFTAITQTSRKPIPRPFVHCSIWTPRLCLMRAPGQEPLVFCRPLRPSARLMIMGYGPFFVLAMIC